MQVPATQLRRRRFPQLPGAPTPGGPIAMTPRDEAAVHLQTAITALRQALRSGNSAAVAAVEGAKAAALVRDNSR